MNNIINVDIKLTPMVIKCIGIATKAHEGQYRKFGNKEAYINHPTRVLLNVQKLFNDKCKELNVELYEIDLENIQCVAVLHDTIEDTFVTKEYLKEQGIPDIIIDNVCELTHREGENYFDYIVRLSDQGMAKYVKLADLQDNMSDLQEGSLKDKYRFAYHYLTSH